MTGPRQSLFERKGEVTSGTGCFPHDELVAHTILVTSDGTETGCKVQTLGRGVTLY